jgi:hypothetical protein
METSQAEQVFMGMARRLLYLAGCETYMGQQSQPDKPDFGNWIFFFGLSFDFRINGNPEPPNGKKGFNFLCDSQYCRLSLLSLEGFFGLQRE